VHAYGPMRVIEEPRELRVLLERLTTRHEEPRPEPWAVADAPDDYLAQQFRGIVGIEIPIARIDGKWKMSQNASKDDMESVAAGLDASGDSTDRETARVMRALSEKRV
jgi:transcriptional regulator